MLITALHA
jgi:hypothetical protein